MKINVLAVLVFGCVLISNAHDWRTDKKAFESAKVDRKIYQKKIIANALAISIDEGAFQEKLEELTGVREVVIDGKRLKIPERGGDLGRSLALKWLTQEYTDLGFTPSTHTFNRGSNFVADKPGTSGKTVILSSHMDSVSNAGANDDGAGTVAGLLIAKALKDTQFQHGIRVLAFDKEETGLQGSRAYVATLDKSKIIGNIQLEMMATNSRRDGHFHVIDCDRSESVFLTRNIMEAVLTLALPLTRVSACTNRSDHDSFWRAGIPAVVLSENFFGGDGDRCYHRTCDVVSDRMDFKYAASIVSAVALALSQLAIHP